MRITWNPLESRFEGEEISVPSDIPFVRSAKWRTDGPPQWIWWCLKASQTGRPSRRRNHHLVCESRLPLLEKFKELKEIEDKNAAVMAELKAARKAQKKEVRLEEVDSDFVTYGGQDGESRIWSKPVVPPPDLLCHVCLTPVYFYEIQNPPTCLEWENFPKRLDI